MRNAHIYLFSKRIHRLLVVLIILLTLPMSITGYMMRENKYFPFDPLAIRMIHRTVSIYFTGVLGGMSLTGLYMFIFPYFGKKQEVEKK